MVEARILHLETATNVCSVALSEGERILALRETDEGRSHGSVLTIFMEEVLHEAALRPADIHAISISKGPGSYTGLRIGVSVTKGFAYAQSIPVIGIPTLKVLTESALQSSDMKKFRKNTSSFLLCPLLDAKRMEVYTALYNESGKEIEAVSAKIIDESSFNTHLKSNPIVFFGNGSDKITDLIQHPNAHFMKHINPSAKYMIPLAMKAYQAGVFENTAYFEPYYLKDFIATIPKKKLL